MMKIFSFGDSWAAGAELAKNEHPFVHWLGDYYNCDYYNYGKEGISLGLITKNILDYSKEISSLDLVTVVIPPDVRWYTEHNGIWKTVGITSNEWKETIIKYNKTPDWFIYHHNLFMYSIISVLEQLNCQYVLMHNYGNLEIKYDNLINFSNFLSQYNLTTLLNGNNDFYWNYDREYFDDGPHSEFRGKYFEGKDFHPNELGHKRIAELIIEYFEDKENNDV